MKKYLLIPGYITSRADGQRHYIDAQRLAKLYHVRMDECCIVREPEGFRGIDRSLVPLRPTNGEYPPANELCTFESALKSSGLERLFYEENPNAVLELERRGWIRLSENVWYAGNGVRTSR